MNLRTNLAALFSPTRRLFGIESPVVQQGGAFGGQQWVVPRSECQYRQADLAALPPRQRVAAARLAAARYQPTPGSLTHIAWRQGVAHLWIWVAPPAEVATQEQRWIPESLLLPPHGDGPRLLQLARGTEGQVWKDGQLATSQWWPGVPDRESWQRFLRAGGLDAADSAPPVPDSLPWADAWGEGGRTWLPGSTAGRERLAWLATGAVIAMLLGWQLTGLARWNLAGARLAADLEAARADMAPVLAARERAEQALAEAERLRQLQGGMSDYELMSRITAALPEGVLLQGWRREPGKLEVLVAGGGTDPRKFVAAFAGKLELAELTATPIASGMRLVFTLPGYGEAGR